MSGSVWAAMLLAGSVLAAPPVPIKRLAMPRRAGRPVAALVVLPVVVLIALSAGPAPVLVCLIAGGVFTSRLLRRRAERNRRREGDAMAAALDVLVGELKVGAHPISAFAIAGAEAGGTVGRSLRTIATRVQLGADVAEGIRSMAVSSAVPAYWERLAVFWQLAAEHGLALTMLMRAAHGDIVDRQRFSDRVHAALAGARATAVILASLPALGILLGHLIGADPIGFLLGGGAGGVLLVLGVTLICVGIVWADRIVDRLAA